MARLIDKVDISVPITPMLDMSFQLLSFFILTFRAAPAEGQLAIALPTLEAIVDPKMELPPDRNPGDSYTVTVQAGTGGEIASLGLQGPALTIEHVKSLPDLLGLLQAIPRPAGRGNESITVTISSAPDLNYFRLMNVMDVCKKAGFPTIHLMPLPKERT